MGEDQEVFQKILKYICVMCAIGDFDYIQEFGDEWVKFLVKGNFLIEN